MHGLIILDAMEENIVEQRDLAPHLVLYILFMRSIDAFARIPEVTYLLNPVSKIN